MKFSDSKNYWLPYTVSIIGIILSFGLFFILRSDIEPRFGVFLQTYDPWITLIFCLSLFILIGFLIRILQLAQIRAVTLKRLNENLQKEIADRINVEETKQKLEVAMVQGQKLQAIGTMAGGIAHDFNNILYAIIGYSEMARDDVDKKSLTYKNLGHVLEASHRGRDLVSRILAFSRRQPQQLEPINLKTTIEAALALLMPTIPASVMVDFEPIDITILGNQTKIHQVLVNLINNAVDSMDGEGKITIHMEKVLAHDPFLKQFPEIKEQNYCKIEVKDTGHGMDKNTMSRIFEPFYTTKEVGKGTGLGLSIVHSIIKEHGGDITVTSQLGRGSTFIILLPEQESALNL